jgi:hypothetical protein
MVTQTEAQCPPFSRRRFACINKIQWHGREFAAVHCVNDTSHLP